MLSIHGEVRGRERIRAGCLDLRHAAARRIHVKNPAQAKIDSTNNASEASSAARADWAAATAKKAAPIAATPAALAIYEVVPYIPAPEPALAGLTVDSTALDSSAITSPWP
jgi:hypothetical protein